jgi:hypothetical protein
VGLWAWGVVAVLEKAGWPLRLRLHAGLRQLGTHSCPKCEGMNGAPGTSFSPVTWIAVPLPIIS